MNLISKKVRFLTLVLSLPVVFSISSCSSTNEYSDIISSMKEALNLYFDESKIGRIEKEKFFLDGALLFGMKAGDYDFRTLHYDFSDNSYFNLTYKEEFGYTDQKDIFRNKLSRGSPGYVGQVVSFPSKTIMLDCTISFSYNGYTVSNILKVELYGGSEATAAASGWAQNDSAHYTYSNSYTLTDDIDRPTQKSKASGSIDLSSMTLDYFCQSDKYVNGLFSHTSYKYSYHYDANTGLIEVTDSTNSYNVKNNSIYLITLYSNSKYQNDKDNGWDWQKLSHVMGVLKTFDKLLVENGKSDYVSIFYGTTYTYSYLFGL